MTEYRVRELIREKQIRATKIGQWRFSKEKIDESLTMVGYENGVTRGDTLLKTEDNVALDLGGIAKGYALKETVKELRKAGVSSALVDLGGDLYALGTHKGKP